MADSYLAVNIRNFVFSKALRIFAAKNLVSYVRKSREVLFALLVITGTITDFWDVLPF